MMEQPSQLSSISTTNNSTPLLQMVKEWVTNDQEIRLLQKQQTKYRAENKKISVQLVEIMKQNNIKHTFSFAKAICKGSCA